MVSTDLVSLGLRERRVLESEKLIRRDGSRLRLAHRRFTVEGMSSVSQAQQVERTLLAVRGVVVARVDLAAGTASITYNPNRVCPIELRDAVRQIGCELSFHKRLCSGVGTSSTTTLPKGDAVIPTVPAWDQSWNWPA